MAPKISTDRARQGKLGKPVLVVLVVSLLLVLAVWAGVEIFGEAIDTPAQQSEPVAG